MSAVSTEHKDYKVKIGTHIAIGTYLWHTNTTLCLRFRDFEGRIQDVNFNRKTAKSIKAPECYFYCTTAERIKSDKQPQKMKVLSYE